MSKSIPRSTWVIGVIVGAAFCSDYVAHAATSETPIIPTAQQGKKGSRKPQALPPALSRAELADLETKLASEAPDDVLAALSAISTAGPRAGVLAARIEDMLRHGSRLDIISEALEALGSIGQTTSSTAIRPYTRHRDMGLRRAAIRAIVRTGGAEAIAALRQGLSDSDSAVRSFSASGLGALRAREAAADLFEALDRGIFDAANAIGQICSVDLCERFAARIGKVPLSVYTSGIEPMLFRPGSEVPEETKVHLIQRLRDVETIEVHRYLRDLLGRWPADGSVRVRQAISAAIHATVGAQR